MKFEFKETTYNITEHQIIHIIEHDGYGTLHHLIEPLQEDIHQHLVCTYNLVNMKFIREKYR